MQNVALRKTVQVLWILVASLMLLAAGDQEARFQTLGHKLMCRCGCNQILLECNHVGCSYSDKMRNELVAAVNGPDSDDLVLQSFVQSYGAVVLAAPTATGFNRVAWITPFAVLFLGITAVVYVVKRWQQRAPQTAPAASGPVEPELDEFRERARKETEL
ncbi:MAG: cytochrome c-type biogenesis protein CcmH [Acidobacteria bacterium]|nr:cytochrome c-type biogenesis protein CcmH [Acidobacteriota bacterium]